MGRVWPQFTPELWEPYLRALEEYGAYILAADIVGCTERDIRKVRRAEADFAVLCEDALERHRQSFVQSARKRAVDGVRRPIIGGRNRDEVVAHEVVFSDGLMSMFLKRHDPEFRDSRKIELTGQVDLHQEMDFSKMSARARSKLRELLEVIKEDEEDARLDAEEGSDDCH